MSAMRFLLGKIYAGTSATKRGNGRLGTWVLLASLVLALVPATAAAKQPRDWIIGATDDGSYLNLDFIFGALQAGAEHRLEIYGAANMLTVRGSGLAALPYGSTQADVDLRILNLTLGTSVGYQSYWRNTSFAVDEDFHRKARRERDAAGEFDTENFPFWEGRASLGFLINDYVAFNHITTYRTSGYPDRTFDNGNSVVNDGQSVRNEFQLALHHRDWGAIVPTFQILNFDLDDNWRTQLNYGFMVVTRAGLVRRDDVLLWQMMFHSGPILGAGIDNRDVYGAAVLRGPFTLVLAYRSQIEL